MLEYKIIESDADHKAEKELNEASKSGWELVEVKMRRRGTNDLYVFLLKRGSA